MNRPKLLDGCCCEGGTHVGYERAGFDVYGIDLFVDYSRKRYPGPSYQGDVVLVLVLLLAGQQIPFTHRDGSVEWLGLADFAAVHVSPPCQHASAGTRAIRSAGAKDYPALIEPLRYLLRQTGLPYVIENVKGAALLDPVMLCGSMFALRAVDEDGMPLRLERHRLFEASFPLTPPGVPHWHSPYMWPAGVYGGSRRAKRLRDDETLAELAPRDRHAARHVRKGGYVPRSVRVRRELLGIDWMTARGMDQAVPPAYAEHVGRQLLAHLNREDVAA